MLWPPNPTFIAWVWHITPPLGHARQPLTMAAAPAWGRIGCGLGACTAIQGTRRAVHGPRGPLGPVGCGGGRGAPPCASHRPISTLERPSPAPWAAPEACLGIRKCGGSVWPLVGLWTSGAWSHLETLEQCAFDYLAHTFPMLPVGCLGQQMARAHVHARARARARSCCTTRLR